MKAAKAPKRKNPCQNDKGHQNKLILYFINKASPFQQIIAMYRVMKGHIFYD